MNIINGYAQLKNTASQILTSVTSSKVLSQQKESALPYAYPCKNYIDAILSNGLVRKTLQLVSDKYCREQIQQLKASGILVTADTYPHFHGVLVECCDALDVVEEPEVYVTNRLQGINALTVGTDDKPIILVSPKSVITLSDGELKFMLGHELGHILQKNLMCHTIKGMLDNLQDKSVILGTMVWDLIEIPLKEWYRCAEYTADRAGLICCKDIKFVYHLANNLNSFQVTNREVDFIELYKIHPFIDKRIKNLEMFLI